ncbi:MAG: hypothetical protein HWE30_13125 [Methylocystaceae bacterium]|nr:hypothetical protein [Methylocystaceae bacterium]
MNVAFSHEVSLNLPIMENRESQINLALSEIYGGLSVIRFLAEEYEGKIDTDDLTLFENNVRKLQSASVFDMRLCNEARHIGTSKLLGLLPQLTCPTLVVQPLC